MDYSRQIEIFNPDAFSIPVHIIGCGATGSWVALMLQKIGVKDLHLWDFDKVEEHNIPNQFFGLEDIGEYKVEALRRKLGGEITSHVQRVVKGTQGIRGIVFVLTDTMQSRNDIYKGFIKNNFNVNLMIETRMGLNCGRIYSINPTNIAQCAEYEKTLYSDEEASVSVCGISQSVAPTAMFTASYAVWQLLKYANDMQPDDDNFENEILFDCQYNTILASNL